MKRAARVLTAPLLCAALLCATANTGFVQAAHVGPVATFTGVGNILHMIDPGATMLRVTIKDLPGVVKNLRGAGVKINSTTGEPTNNQLVIQATDGVFLQLTNAREPAARP